MSRLERARATLALLEKLRVAVLAVVGVLADAIAAAVREVEAAREEMDNDV